MRRCSSPPFSANVDAQTEAWSLLRSRWAQLARKTGQFGGNTVIIGALGGFCDARTAQEAKQFFTIHKVPDAARTLEQALERIRAMLHRSGDPGAEAGGVACRPRPRRTTARR